MADAKPNKSTSTIQSKLLEFQKQKVSVKKTKNNPHFKNDYADINEVLDKVKPVLSDLGVVIIQIPLETGLKTILHDTDSGTEIESFIGYTNAPDPQKLGSHITYYRRYSLVSLLGLEDNDDDGQKASEAKPSMTMDQAFKKLRDASSVPHLEGIFKQLPASFRKDDEIIMVAKEVKQKLLAAEKEMDEDVIDATQ